MRERGSAAEDAVSDAEDEDRGGERRIRCSGSAAEARKEHELQVKILTMACRMPASFRHCEPRYPRPHQTWIPHPQTHARSPAEGSVEGRTLAVDSADPTRLMRLSESRHS